MLNGLDLFSGIGGFGIALAPWVRTVAYCEQDPYCQAVLLSRMRDGSIDYAPVWEDVRTLDAEELSTLSHPIDIITGGFPCQDISVAGNGVGLGGSRSSLFFEIIRLAGELRPRFIFLENVPAITVRGLDRVLLELTSIGYDSRWTIVSAAEVGAIHLRERWFLLAHANDEGPRSCDGIRPDPDSETVRLPKRRSRWSVWKREGFDSSLGEEGPFAGTPARLAQPRVGRTGDGIPYRVDRDRMLGNSVCPAAVKKAFKKLIGIQGGPSRD